MRRSISVPLTLLITLLIATPGALATWRTLGSYEPDTLDDQVRGFMFGDPNRQPVEKVYLNVVGVQRDTTINPNTGVTGSRFLMPGSVEFQAFFGSWIDCNLDGYVGHLETVMFEYPSQLLPPNGPCATMPMYNQQGWVSELRWIANYVAPGAYGGFDGNEDGIPDGRDGRSIRDLGAHVWGDFGVPGDTMGREICPRDRPLGTTETTGRVLNWADCFTAHRLWETSNAVLPTLGMGFAEEDNFDQAGHPLNQNTLGRDHGSESYATVWDCSAKREEVQTGQGRVATQPVNYTTPASPTQNTLPWFQVIDGDGHLNVSGWSAGTYSGEWKSERFLSLEPTQPRPVAPSGPNTGGSVAGTYNHTRGGYAGSGNLLFSGDGCDSRQRVYDQFENPNALAESSANKNRVTLRFTYYEEQRNGIRQQGMPFYGAFLYPVMRSGNVPFVSGSQWYSQGAAPSELGSQGPTPPQLIRTSDLQPEGAIYWTFYANLTAESLGRQLQVPPAAPGVYGAEWCARSSDPKLNGGFVCDPDKWYVSPDGTRLNTAWWPLPGKAYHLRDVDCYDGTLLRGAPARASLTDVSSSGACKDAVVPT